MIACADAERTPTPADLRAEADELLARIDRLIDQRERELSMASMRSRSN